jgi:4-diphosphocytidyl-2-C-methyl-D-erythritol kinase
VVTISGPNGATSGTTPAAGAGRIMAPVTVDAPAKLTLSLRVTGVRPDGYHLIDAEMVSVDLVDSLTFEPGLGVAVVDRVVGGLGIGDLGDGPGNLVSRALALAGRQAAVRVVKRIPVGAGLGGGSADAAAVLRWAAWPSASLAASLGADVPFCMTGGAARVTGIGEVVEARPYRDRRFVLLIPPIAVSTAAVYRVYDEHAQGAGVAPERSAGVNDLEAAALSVAPELAHWRDMLGEVTGCQPVLAGSGATWFVEGDPEALGIDDRPFLVLKGTRAPVVPVRTVRPEPAV